MPRWLALILLIVSPVVMTAGIFGMLSFAAGFRKSFGAHSTLRPEALAVAALLWLIHVGFVLAPFLYMNGRKALAMWLTLPIAFVATLLIGWVFLQQSAAPRNVASGVADLIMWMMLIGGVVVYWGPVGALLTGK